MSINWKLLEKVFDWLAEHPERWDQRTFTDTIEVDSAMPTDPLKSCGTTFCIAGVAIALNKMFELNHHHSVYRYLVKDHLSAFHLGKNLLGLTQRQASLIFTEYPPEWKSIGIQGFKDWVYKLLTDEDFYMSEQRLRWYRFPEDFAGNVARP